MSNEGPYQPQPQEYVELTVRALFTRTRRSAEPGWLVGDVMLPYLHPDIIEVLPLRRSVIEEIYERELRRYTGQ